MKSLSTSPKYLLIRVESAPNIQIKAIEIYRLGLISL